MQHFREPVHGSLFIGRAHAFDKRTDRIVVRIACAIVNDRFLLNAFLGNREREMDGSVFARRRSREHADLERV